MKRTHAASMAGATALLTSLTLVAVALPATAKAPCTYDMAADMPAYDATGETLNVYPGGREGDVLAGEVVCGGPGRDAVHDVHDGGVFRGHGGDDSVKGVRQGGTAVMGRGNDQIYAVWGRAYMGPGADTIDYIWGDGFAHGGLGDDSVATQMTGYGADVPDGGPRFKGGWGDDHVDNIGPGAKVAGGKGRDTLGSMWHDLEAYGGLHAPRFYGGRGADRVSNQSGGFARGGPGWDKVVLDCKASENASQHPDVEKVVTDAECRER